MSFSDFLQSKAIGELVNAQVDLRRKFNSLCCVNQWPNAVMLLIRKN